MAQSLSLIIDQNDYRHRGRQPLEHFNDPLEMNGCLLLLVSFVLITIISMNMVEGRHLSTSSSSVDDQTIECTLDNFQQCISGLWSSSGSNGSSDLAFPTTAEQLRLTCADLKKRVRCLDRHSEHCFTHQMMQVFGHIVTNAKQFVHDLCDDRKVQAGKPIYLIYLID